MPEMHIARIEYLSAASYMDVQCFLEGTLQERRAPLIMAPSLKTGPYIEPQTWNVRIVLAPRFTGPSVQKLMEAPYTAINFKRLMSYELIAASSYPGPGTASVAPCFI